VEGMGAFGLKIKYRSAAFPRRAAFCALGQDVRGRVEVSGFRIQVSGSRFRVSGVGFRTLDSGFRVLGFGFHSHFPGSGHKVERS